MGEAWGCSNPEIDMAGTFPTPFSPLLVPDANLPLTSTCLAPRFSLLVSHALNSSACPRLESGKYDSEVHLVQAQNSKISLGTDGQPMFIALNEENWDGKHTHGTRQNCT